MQLKMETQELEVGFRQGDGPLDALDAPPKVFHTPLGGAFVLPYHTRAQIAALSKVDLSESQVLAVGSLLAAVLAAAGRATSGFRAEALPAPEQSLGRMSFAVQPGRAGEGQPGSSSEAPPNTRRSPCLRPSRPAGRWTPSCCRRATATRFPSLTRGRSACASRGAVT